MKVAKIIIELNPEYIGTNSQWEVKFPEHVNFSVTGAGKTPVKALKEALENLKSYEEFIEWESCKTDDKYCCNCKYAERAVFKPCRFCKEWALHRYKKEK